MTADHVPVRSRRNFHTAAATLLALCGAIADAAASDSLDVQVHGFIGQGYVVTNRNGYYDPATCDGGSLDFREIGLNVVCRPEERLRLGIQLLSQDMGRLYNNDISVDWANAVYTVPVQDWEADIKVGRIRTGHALYNDFRDLDLSRTSVFLPESVYYNSWRRLYIALDGVGTEVRSPATHAGTFILGAVYGTQQVPADDPMLEAYDEVVASSDIKQQWGVQLSWLPIEGLTLKQSLFAIDDWNIEFSPADPTAQGSLLRDDSPIDREFVTSLEYINGRLNIATEFLWWTIKGISSYTGATPDAIDHDNWEQSGYGGYGSVGWELTPTLKAQVLVQAHNMRYSGSYPDPYSGSDQTRAAGAAACWSITPHWLLKGEVQRVKGTYFLRDADQPDGPESEYWTLFALKTSFDF